MSIDITALGPVPIDLGCIYVSDTWDGLPIIGPTLINGEQPESPLTRIRLEWRRASTDVASTYNMDTVTATGVGSVVIDDAASWTAHVPPQGLPLPPGTWRFTMAFTDAAATTAVLVVGKIKILRP